MNAIPDVRLTCVSDYTIATYSGMLAGTLAGDYRMDEMEIDLVRLCASAGVRFVHARATGMDVERKRLHLEDRPSIPFDVLSVGVGSRPKIPLGCEGGLSIKPMQTFHARLRERLQETQRLRKSECIRIAIVGGGAAGVEIATCLDQHLRSGSAYDGQYRISLLESGKKLLAEMPSSTQQLAAAALQRREIELLLDARVASVENEREVVFESGERKDFDLVIWATSAVPSPLLGKLGLPLDERGFVRTRRSLQSIGSDDVFAVGDAGSVDGEEYSKAGVFAVRQGPVLWENLQRRLREDSPREWHPQSTFLSLLNTGDRQAILTYRSLSLHNHTSWRLKDWIDTRFMAKYQQYEASAMSMGGNSEDAPMQCGGCGCKASARVLRESLPDLKQPEFDQVLIGLDQPDDVALLKTQGGDAVAVSTDFFSAFVDDPYLLGRIAALNALSDLYAKDMVPTAALSIAVLPPGAEHKQSELLCALLAGAKREFNEAGAPIVGGHSIVGPKLTFGFTVIGEPHSARRPTKTDLKPGDQLVLTKPLGTGVLLAAHMQAACQAAWWGTLQTTMLESNLRAASAARANGVVAMTDVTGFGLAGHLQEMLSNSGLTAELTLGSLPVLPGAMELLQQGFQSTLAPSNRENCQSLDLTATLEDDSQVQLLFDPQTSGGLLLAVSETRVDELTQATGGQSAVIGRVLRSELAEPAIRLQAEGS